MARDFDPYALMEALEHQRVTYIVVGGLGRVIHGSDELTDGLDIVPSLREENLRRLGLALDRAQRPPFRRQRTGAGVATWPASRYWNSQPRPASSRSSPSRPARAATTTSADAPASSPSGAACAPRLPRSTTTPACSPLSAAKTTASRSSPCSA